jgi:glutaconyl-CoA/methylmalonyl-CoA decarboxylase subunit gamma
MKKYRVHVNGKTYDVAVEEIGEAVSAAVSVTPAAEPVSRVPQAAPAGAEVIYSPMPGKVVAIKVRQARR